MRAEARVALPKQVKVPALGPVPQIARTGFAVGAATSIAPSSSLLSALSGSLRRASQMLARSLEQVFAWASRCRLGQTLTR
jgi:hypothetical protein